MPANNIKQINDRLLSLRREISALLTEQQPVVSDADLTNEINILHNQIIGDGGLCMKGKIRTQEKCVVCGGKYADNGKSMSCPNCKTRAEKVYLDVHWKGRRYRIFRDRSGDRLDSYQKALRLLERIRGEIDDRSLDQWTSGRSEVVTC